MKRAVGFVMGVTLALAIGCGRGSGKATAQPATDQAAVPPEAAAALAQGQERVAHQFDTDEQMRQFVQMWQKRQAIMVRMAVLESYFDQEQAVLAEVNKTLATDYHLDISGSKNYTLDDKRKAIIERPGPAAPQATETPSPEPATP